MIEYKSYRFIDRKARWIIVDETGNIINRNPSKDKLKGLEKETYKQKRNNAKYTDNELLNYLKRFYDENGRVPVETDFDCNSGYPNFNTCVIRFGSWNNALKLVGMDIDTRVLQGHLKTEMEKARYAELKIINHFEKHSIDLAGENCLSPCDGICPNGKSYDVKSSKLHRDIYWMFNTNNKYREEIEIYYFLGFNEDYTKLEYVWRVPGEIIEKDIFYIGSNSWSNAKFTIYNMKEYDITDKFKDIMKI